MRSILFSALLMAGAAGTAHAQGLAGGPQGLDCRPVSTQQVEKGVSVTRSFRSNDLQPVGTINGMRCYAPRAQAPAAPPATGRSDRTVVIVNGGFGGFGVGGFNAYNLGTSPNVLGAPLSRRY